MGVFASREHEPRSSKTQVEELLDIQHQSDLFFELSRLSRWNQPQIRQMNALFVQHAQEQLLDQIAFDTIFFENVSHTPSLKIIRKLVLDTPMMSHEMLSFPEYILMLHRILAFSPEDKARLLFRLLQGQETLYQEWCDSDSTDEQEHIQLSLQNETSFIAFCQHSQSWHGFFHRFRNHCFPSKDVHIDSSETDKGTTDITNSDINPNTKTPKGVSGLDNLGNTCFLNSVVQCMSNTPVLTNYFVEDRYLRDLSPSNPLGTRGRLAQDYARLLKTLWAGQHRSVSPHKLKKTLAAFAPRFRGYEQHDAQELLAVLLDALHEDLNIASGSTPVGDTESETDSDTECGKEQAEKRWKKHLVKNKSMVVDLFQGMYKSTVSCPQDDCTHVSTTFDPFMYLSIPLPKENQLISVNVSLLPSDTALHPPSSYLVQVPASSSVEDLLQALAELAGISRPDSLVLGMVRAHRVQRIFQDSRLVPMPGQGERLVAFQQESRNPESLKEPCKTMQIVMRSEDTNQFICTPLVLVFPDCGTNAHLLQLVQKRLYHWANNEQGAYTLCVLCPKTLKCGLCSEEGCTGCPFVSNDELCIIGRNRVLVIRIDKAFQDTFQNRETSLYTVVNLPKAPNHAKDSHSSPTKTTIYDCFAEFARRERLGRENTWNCDKCKQPRRAVKQMRLWTLPEVLIVHLKRFQTIGRCGREKLSFPVHYPISGLDLSQFVCPESDEIPPLYDLFAVVCHLGSMNRGHYIALAKNLLDEKWYKYDDSRTTLVTAGTALQDSAYVLFYRKRH